MDRRSLLLRCARLSLCARFELAEEKGIGRGILGDGFVTVDDDDPFKLLDGSSSSLGVACSGSFSSGSDGILFNATGALRDCRVGVRSGGRL